MVLSIAQHYWVLGKSSQSFEVVQHFYLFIFSKIIFQNNFANGLVALDNLHGFCDLSVVELVCDDDFKRS